MNESITYHDETGRITGVLTATSNTMEPNMVGLWVYGAGDTDLEYVHNGEIVARPIQRTEVNGQILQNLPAPCEIDVNGETYQGTGDTFVLPVTSGPCRIKVIAWPYIDAVFTTNL